MDNLVILLNKSVVSSSVQYKTQFDLHRRPPSSREMPPALRTRFYELAKRKVTRANGLSIQNTIEIVGLGVKWNRHIAG